MNETPCRFGPGTALLGIHTPPLAGRAPSGLGVVLFNAGVIPRHGPHRLNVKLARVLAAEGHAVLRCDLSGLGDSPHVATPAAPAAQGGQSAQGDFRDQAVRDLRAAMDELCERQGVQRIVLIGFCSGAVNAYWTSLADARVAGLLMMDGFWYRSRWTTPVRDLKRALNVSWATRFAAVGRRLAALWGAGQPAAVRGQGGAAAAPPGLFDVAPEQANPPVADFSRHMGELVARGTRVFVLYTGSVLDYVSYAGQFRHVFGAQPWFPQVRCDFRTDIDHTLLTQASQQTFIGLVRGWLSEEQDVREAQERPHAR